MTDKKEKQDGDGLSTESDSTVEITPPDDSDSSEPKDSEDNG